VQSQFRSLIVAVCLALAFTPAALPAASQDQETDPLVLKKLEWFQDQKFGFFMHWGIYSQWGCIESWPLVEVDKWARPDDLKPWQDRGKDFPRFFRDYRALNTTFNPQRFDPEKWAAAARSAGMKYVVFTTKHHDGFCMFDSRQTDYRATHPSCPFHANPRADAAKAVFQAFRKAGFGIGVYFSKADWHHSDYWSPDRPHPDRNVNYDTRREPEKWQRFVRFTHAQIEELMTGYGPVDILWLDAGQVRPPQQDIDMPKLAAMARRHQPGLIVVDRTVTGRYENYRTPEQEVPEKALPFVWETCMTMGDQWSYKPDDRYKSTHRLVHLLVDIVAKGGNFLLNVGPSPDGELPPEALKRLDEIGAWMKVNGDAIYGTRAIAPYKEGRTCLTRKKDRLYLIYLGEEGQAGPPAEIRVAAVRKARTVRMLGTEQPVDWRVDDRQGLTIRVPETLRAAPPCRHAWAFEAEGAP
jgi:alpha-L-fucosidase